MSLLLLASLACSDYQIAGNTTVTGGTSTSTSTLTGTGEGTGACDPAEVLPAEVGVGDTCGVDNRGFEPIVEWGAGDGKTSTALPAVGDLNGDGMPEIVVMETGLLGPLVAGSGELVVYRGDGGGIVWEDDKAKGAYGSGPALGDIDHDGKPEVVIVREYKSSLLAEGDYTVVAYSWDGQVEWESEHYTGADFDYATAINLSDMDHDGHVEIVAGRVILNADGTLRGVGKYGRGSYGILLGISEASVSAVADLDLDGVEEVIVGNAIYNADGTALWHDADQPDAMISVANLDDDQKGEFVAVSWNTVRAHDTYGDLLWGPITIQTANICSPPAIGDIDGDGQPEIVVAGGNEIYAFERDGTVLWQNAVVDQSGASGASLFDFEGDGVAEVVYIDEIEMVAFDGLTGAVKFYNSDHASVTMMDYPVIADVDADDQAEIVVVHSGSGRSLSVFGDRLERWLPTRRVWNQHPYSITNVNDDLSIPTTAVMNFTTYNSFHGAIDRLPGENLAIDLEAEIVEICDDPCDGAAVPLTARMVNRGGEDAPAGVWMTLYAEVGGQLEAVSSQQDPKAIKSGLTGTVLGFTIDADRLRAASRVMVVADDDGTGAGTVEECAEDNNTWEQAGPFCQ